MSTTCHFSSPLAPIASSSRRLRASAARSRPATSFFAARINLAHATLPVSSNAKRDSISSFRSTSTSATSSSSSPSSSSSSEQQQQLLLDRLSSTITPSTIVVVGAGIAGVATARALSLAGVDDFVVLERAPGPRAEGTSIGLWTNAWRALDALRVGDELRSAWPAMQGVQLFDQRGRKLREVMFDDCVGAPHEARGVGRAALVRAMAEKLPAEKKFFGVKVVSVRDRGGEGVEVDVEVLQDGSETKKRASLRCRAVVAADGVGSTLVQQAIRNSSSTSSSSSSSSLLKPLRYVGYTAYRGIASFPEDRVPSVIPRDRFRIYFGKGVRCGVVPLGVHSGGVAALSGGNKSDGGDDGDKKKENRALFYWFTTQNEPGADKSPKITDVSWMRRDAANAISGWDLQKTGIDLLQNASDDATWSRAAISDRWLDGNRSYGAGAVTAVGDAAHPMTPNTGQGGCVGLEDAVELARALKSVASSEENEKKHRALAGALRDFERARSTRARKVQIKSFAIGFAGQLDVPLFAPLRDFLVSSVYPIEEFMDLACYDCGGL